MAKCQHVAPGFPVHVVVDRGQELPKILPPGWELWKGTSFPAAGPAAIVECLRCGAPLNRGRWTGMMSDPYAALPAPIEGEEDE